MDGWMVWFEATPHIGDVVDFVQSCNEAKFVLLSISFFNKGSSIKYEQMENGAQSVNKRLQLSSLWSLGCLIPLAN